MSAWPTPFWMGQKHLIDIGHNPNHKSHLFGWDKKYSFCSIDISLRPSPMYAKHSKCYIMSCRVKSCHVKSGMWNEDGKEEMFTLWGCFWTISTASWLVSCSQRPSDANMRNWSNGWISCMDIDGSELNIGFLIGSRRRNLAYKGSLLNSAFLRYTSPIDLDIYNIHNPKHYPRMQNSKK